MRSTLPAAEAARPGSTPASGSALAAIRKSLRFMTSSPKRSGLASAPERRGDVGNDFSERPGVAGPAEIVAGGRFQRQQREHQFGEAVAFLEMRIAREDEAIDAERDVFLHEARDLFRIADQRRASAAAHETHPGPKVGV